MPGDAGTAGDAERVVYALIGRFALVNNISVVQIAVVLKFLLQEGDVEALREFMFILLNNDIAKYKRHPWKDFHVIATAGLMVAAATTTQQ